MSQLPQLRKSLMAAAEQQARRGLPVTDSEPQDLHSGNAPVAMSRRWRLPRLLRVSRGSAVLISLAGLLALAAVAYATTQLIQTGSPVRSEEGFSANAGAGVAIPKTEGLLGIAASDPTGGPPWTMRVYDTSRGLGCAQVGRLVDGRIGVLGQDGAFQNDGRFHPLPSQASQAEGDCVLLDGHGHAFLGVGTYGEPASGLPRQCHLLGSRAAQESCARSDPRDIFYGLLGPDARSITYTLKGQTHTIPTVGGQGAYLIVERTPAKLAAMGVEVGGSGALPAGGGTLSGLPLQQPIRRITYTGGRTCTITRSMDRGDHGGRCVPPVGYAPQHIRVPSARELASPVNVRTTFGQGLPRNGEVLRLLVSFVAHIAVRSALSGYSMTLESPDSGNCQGRPEQVNAQVGRNVQAGEQVQLTLSSVYADPHSLFPGCPGVAHGRVTYSVPSFEVSSAGSYGPFARRHSRIVTVGRFTYANPS